MRTLPWLTAIVVGLGVWSGTASAQWASRPLGGVPTPAFSPYLNLVQRGNNPAVNYYGLVRPQLEFRRSLQAVQGQLLKTEQALSNQTAAFDASLSGQPVTFLNYRDRFMNQGGYFLNAGAGTGHVNTVASPARSALGSVSAAPTRSSYRR